MLLAVCLVITAVADILFYRTGLGCNLGLFLFILGGLAWVMESRRLWTIPGKVISLALLAVVAALFLDSGPLAFIMGMLLCFMLRIIGLGRWSTSVFTWGLSLIDFLLTGWFSCFRRNPAVKENKNKWGSISLIGVIKWGIPGILSLVFIVLFGFANPIIDNWISAVFKSLWGCLENITLPDPGRIFLWLFIGVWVWAFIQMSGRRFALVDWVVEQFRLTVAAAKSGGTFFYAFYRRWRRTAPAGAAVDDVSAFSMFCAGIVWRCLLLFNVIFLLQNLLDIRYLWAGMTLPQGMSYASYAHRGAYPLIATALLAAVFVLLCFSGDRDRSIWRWPRLLVYFWLGQNVFLVCSAVKRLMLYVSVYHLTLLRVAAMIWMALIAVGLMLILIKIVTGKNNVWLVNANLVTLFVSLLLCCFIDFRGMVADYNVRQCRENVSAVDLGYLGELGVNALPAVELLRSLEGKMSPEQQRMLNMIRNKLIIVLSEDRGWQAWTWRSYCLRQQYGHLPRK